MLPDDNVTDLPLNGTIIANYSSNGSTTVDWIKLQINIPYAYVMYVGVMCTMCALGLVGNGLTIAVLRRDSGHSMFLLQVLAFVDSAFLVTSVVYLSIRHIVYHTTWFPLSARDNFVYVLLVFRPLWYFSNVASVWMVVLVTVARYVAVCKPMQVSHVGCLFSLIIWYDRY